MQLEWNLTISNKTWKVGIYWQNFRTILMTSEKSMMHSINKNSLWLKFWVCSFQSEKIGLWCMYLKRKKDWWVTKFNGFYCLMTLLLVLLIWNYFHHARTGNRALRSCRMITCKPIFLHSSVCTHTHSPLMLLSLSTNAPYVYWRTSLTSQFNLP